MTRETKKGTLNMDASIGKCSFKLAESGEPLEPCIMHFAANEAPLSYTLQLFKLYKKNRSPTRGLFKLGALDVWERYIKSPLHRMLKKMGLK